MGGSHMGGGSMGGSHMGGGSMGAGHSGSGQFGGGFNIHSNPGGNHSGGNHNFNQSQGLHINSGHGSSGLGRGDAWNHGWNDFHGGWNHDRDWWHDHGHNWVGWWGIDFGWPSYGFGWWPGYYYYSVPYYGAVYDDYGYTYDVAPYTAAYPPADTTTAAAPPANDEGMDYYPRALAAFQQGDYRNATRLAGHASIDDPRNPDVHVLLMLGLFAMGEYRGAAMEAHAVASLGKVPDWAALFAFYGTVEPYTEQLRALEKHVKEHPSAPDGRFLLGLQYMMEGHKDVAKNEFLQALKLTPKDRLAAQLLTQAGGTVPADIAKQLAQPPAAPLVPPAPKAGP